MNSNQQHNICVIGSEAQANIIETPIIWYHSRSESNWSLRKISLSFSGLISLRLIFEGGSVLGNPKSTWKGIPESRDILWASGPECPDEVTVEYSAFFWVATWARRSRAAVAYNPMDFAFTFTWFILIRVTTNRNNLAIARYIVAPLMSRKGVAQRAEQVLSALCQGPGDVCTLVLLVSRATSVQGVTLSVSSPIPTISVYLFVWYIC